MFHSFSLENSMGRVANGKLIELWRGRIGKQQRSGLSIRKYCRREGLSEGNFHYWKRRLREMGSTNDRPPTAKRSGQRRPEAKTRSNRSGFVQVAWSPSQVIEVFFADGTVLKLPVQLDALAVTLQSLRTPDSEGHVHD